MRRPSLAFIFAITLLGALCCQADSPDKEADTILDSAQALFKAMKQRDYKTVWDRLTQGSRETIVNDTRRAIVLDTPTDTGHSKEILERDFASGGSVANSYWDAYLQNFDPDWLLEESRWQMGEITKDRAEIVIRYRKGEGPVCLKMTREKGDWKAGLMETFRPSTR